MKELFDIEADSLGQGPVACRWGAKGSILVAAGVNRQVVLFNKEGRETHSFLLDGAPSKSPSPQPKVSVNALEWSPKGTQPISSASAELPVPEFLGHNFAVYQVACPLHRDRAQFDTGSPTSCSSMQTVPSSWSHPGQTSCTCGTCQPKPQRRSNWGRMSSSKSSPRRAGQLTVISWQWDHPKALC